MAGTGNPVPSDAIADLKANADTLDQFVSSAALSATTRTGKTIKTIQGVIEDGDNAVQNVITSGKSAIDAIGYNFLDPSTFNTGATINNSSDALLWSSANGGNGEYYRWAGSLPKTVAAGSTPASSGGVSENAWRAVGSGSLREQITEFGATPEGAGGAALKTTSSYDKRTQNKAVIGFIFDGGYSGATPIIESLFKARNITCGLAPTPSRIGGSGFSVMGDFVRLRSEGFEIMPRSFDGKNLSSATEEEVLSEVENSKAFMDRAGFNSQCYVAANSSINQSHRHVALRFYDKIFSVYNGDATGASAFLPDNLELDSLYRTNLYSVGVQGAKDIIDLCIANDASVIFYDHDPTQVGNSNSLTETQLTDVLDYAVASGIAIENPSDVIDKIHSSTMKGFNVERTSNEAKGNYALSKQNLVVDDNFIEIRYGTGTPTEWFALNNGLSSLSEINVNHRNNYREGLIIISDQETAGAGDLILLNRSTKFNLHDVGSILTFSSEIQVRSGYTPKIDLEISLRDESTKAPIYSTTHENIYADGNEFRLSSVSLPTEFNNASFTFIQIAYRVTPTVTNSQSIVAVRKPMLNFGLVPAEFSKGVGASRNLLTESSITATTVPTSTRTQIALTPLDFGFLKWVSIDADGTIRFRAGGHYSVSCYVSVGGLTAGSDQLLLASNKNNAAGYTHQKQVFASSSVCQADVTHTSYMNAGDTLQFYIWQDSGADKIVITGSNSQVVISRVGD